MQEEAAFDLVGATVLGRRVGSERGSALGLIPIWGDERDYALAVVDAGRRRLHGGVGAFDELVDVSVGALTNEHPMCDGGATRFGPGRPGGAGGEAAGCCRDHECGGDDSGVLCVFHASTVTTPGMNSRRRRYERGIHAGTPPLTVTSPTPTLQV